MKSIEILAFSDWRVQDIDRLIVYLKNMDKKPDVIVYAGDDILRFNFPPIKYLPEDQMDEIERRYNITSNQFERIARYSKYGLCAVAGNDDFPLLVSHVITGKNIYNIHEKPFTIDNYAFIGLEGATGEIGRLLHSEEEVKVHLNKMLKRLKNKDMIIVSHNPPYGILDFAIRYERKHIGSTALRNFIEKNSDRVKLVICGHVHSQGHINEKLGNTIISNVSSHDDSGAKGNFVLFNISEAGINNVEWHDTLETLEEGSLEHLHGISSKTAEKLRKGGVGNIIQLAGYENLNKLAQLSGFSKENLHRFQLKAKSQINHEIYQIASYNLDFKKKIFFDIETDLAQERVWLIGLQIEDQFIQLFAKNWEKEKEILEKFVEILKNNPDHVLISYSGNNFDHDLLVKSMRRYKMDTEILDSHACIDLCSQLKNSFIFPIQSYKLKVLGTYLGYKFRNRDLNGIVVANNYQKYIENGTLLDPKILEYNEDDVKAIQFIIEKDITAIAKINKDLFHEGDTFNFPLKDGPEKDRLILQILDYYENSPSNIRIRKGKGSEIRIVVKNSQELKLYKEIMEKLGFRAGKPQQKSPNRWYIPFGGEQQVRRFMEIINPRIKNDISDLRSNN